MTVFIYCLKCYSMNNGLIYNFPRSMVFMESGKINANKQGTEMNTKKLRYKGEKDDQLRKVLKSKEYNLIIDGRTVVSDWYGFRSGTFIDTVGGTEFGTKFGTEFGIF